MLWSTQILSISAEGFVTPASCDTSIRASLAPETTLNQSVRRAPLFGSQVRVNEPPLS
jgi:hypothetical protein